MVEVANLQQEGQESPAEVAQSATLHDAVELKVYHKTAVKVPGPDKAETQYSCPFSHEDYPNLCFLLLVS